MCDKKYTAHHSLKNHIKENHSEKRVFPKCDPCNKTFKTEGSLYYHYDDHSDDQYHHTTSSTTPAPEPEQCLHVLTSPQFQLQSPSHTNSRDCDYVIIPLNDVCSIFLTFSWFILKDSPNCTDEYLEIMGNKLCGNLSGQKSKFQLKL